jgi:hypothetical protein
VKFANYDGRPAAADGEHAVDVAERPGARTSSFSRTPSASWVFSASTGAAHFELYRGHGYLHQLGLRVCGARATEHQISREFNDV